MNLNLSQVSKATKKNFLTPSPKENPKGFINSLIEIIQKEKIDYLIPTFEEALYISYNLDKFQNLCEVFCSDYNTMSQLHNKWSFYKKLQLYEFPTLPTFLLRSENELKDMIIDTPFVIKSCYSRGSICFHKIENYSMIPKLKIESHNPLIAQKWAEGKKYCTFSVSHNGKIYAHTVYPVEYAIDGNSCISFKAIEHKKINEYVESFIAKENYTGQAAFDFIENEDGTLYCIECNPRTTSGIHLFNPEDRVADAFFQKNDQMITPPLGRTKQLAIAMSLWGWRKGNPSHTFWGFFKKMFSTKDVICTRKDLRPFLLQPFLFSIYFFKSLWNRLPLPAYFTSDLEWNGELAYKNEYSEEEPSKTSNEKVSSL